MKRSLAEFYNSFDKVKYSLIERSPIFHALVDVARPIATTDVPFASVSYDIKTDTVRLNINQDAWFDLTLTQQQFILCHEMLHLLFKHFSRHDITKNKITHEVNVAMDLPINHALIRSGFKRKLVDPENMLCWTDTVFEDPVSEYLSYDSYLRMMQNKDNLKQQQPQYSKCGNGNDYSQGQGNEPGQGNGNEQGQGNGNEQGQGNGNEPGQGQGNGQGNEPGQGQGNGQGNEPGQGQGNGKLTNNSHEYIQRGSLDKNSNDKLSEKIHDALSRFSDDQLDDLKKATNYQQNSDDSSGASYDRGSSIFDFIPIRTKPNKRWTKEFSGLCSALRKKYKKKAGWVFHDKRVVALEKTMGNLIVPKKDNKKVTERIPRVFVFLDFSGSCMSYAEKFVKVPFDLDPKEFDIRLYAFSTHVLRLKVNKYQRLDGVFGGTDFQCIENAIQEEIQTNGIPYPDKVFVVTDGDTYGNFNPEYPDRWVYLLVPNSRESRLHPESKKLRFNDYFSDIR